MKKLVLVVTVVFMSLSAFGQEHVNLKGNYAAQGYDVVSYFNDTPEKGNKKITHTHDGVMYKFASEENKEAFKSNPDKYIPQYGGYCAYAIAVKGEKVSVNPKTYLISEDKLYLFYNSWGVNTLEKWNDEDPTALQKEADKRWLDITKTH